ncbi:MAG: DUF3068 domain-containing protein [Jatrophihabitans sp.]
MRKGSGIVAIGVAVFALLLAILLPTYAVPRSKKTPLDLNVTIVSNGSAQVLDASTGQAQTKRLRATRIVKSDSAKSDGTNTVVNETLCIIINENNPPNCLPSSDPRLLSVTTDRVATNRKSGEAVNIAKYGANVNGDSSVKHEGMAYKWPIDSKKKTYQFFEPDLGKAFPAKYVDSEKLKGLTVYKYVCDISPQPYKIQGLLDGTYADTRTVWVEPKTGAIVKGQEKQVQTLSTGQVALDVTFTFDDKSQNYQADFAKKKIKQLKLAQIYLPIIALIVGIAALVAAFFLLRSRGEAGPVRAPRHPATVGGPPSSPPPGPTEPAGDAGQGPPSWQDPDGQTEPRDTPTTPPRLNGQSSTQE